MLVFLLARGSAPKEFGLLMIGYSIVTMAMVVSRNGFGGVLGLDLPRLDGSRSRNLVARSVVAVMLVSAIFGLVVAVFSLTVLTPGGGRYALLVLALGLPVILLQDFQRYWAVAIGEPSHAAVADFVWLLIVGVALILPVVGVYEVSPAVGSAAWVSGALVSSLVFAAMGYLPTPRFAGFVSWIRSDGRRIHLVSESALASASPLVNSSVVAAVGGAQVVAAIRGAGVLFGPLNLIAATIPLAVVPEAVRVGKPRALVMFRVLAMVLVFLATAWGVFLYSLPDSLGEGLLGPSWSFVQPIVLITAMEYVGLGVWAVSRSRLRVQGRLRAAVRLRFGYSILALLAPAGAISIWGTSMAVAASLALTSIGIALVGWVVARD